MNSTENDNLTTENEELNKWIMMVNEILNYMIIKTL